jgi:hypothetical protein
MKDLSKNLKARAAIRSSMRYWYKLASTQEVQDGLKWYPKAHTDCQRMARIKTKGAFSPLICAGVVSALSPNNKWNRNLYDAENVLQAVADNKPSDSVKVCTYTSNKLKAFEIARGNKEILSKSPKTYAFAKNVGELDEKFVTIDVWHLRACQTRSLTRKQDVRESVTPLQYKIIQEETMKVAKEFGLKGYEFQAIVWVTIRNRWSNQ